jgi:hypothetical protein
VYTTEEKEKVRVQAYTEKFSGDMQKAVAALANDIRDEQKNERL